MKKLTTKNREGYTPVEDVNDARQLIALIKERPAVRSAGEHRGTFVAYAELVELEKWLRHAVETLTAESARQTVSNISGYVPTPQNNALEAARAMNAEADFVRPLGVPPVGRWAQMRGYDVLLLGSADYIECNGELYSINGDSGDQSEIPFGIRWVVTKENMERNSYGTKMDAVAVDEFRRAGKLR